MHTEIYIIHTILYSWHISISNLQDVIASVPPHWNVGIKEDHGSRWAGQGITVDSRVAVGAPPRVEGNNPPAFEYDADIPEPVEDEYADVDAAEDL